MEIYKVTFDDNLFGAVNFVEKSNPFDYLSYEKSLEKILEQSQKEYWTHYIDINRHQVVVGRNNLWVAVALIGALSALYSAQHTNIDLKSIVGILFTGAFLTVVIAFGVCLYAMPSRRGYTSVYEKSWSDFSISAYERLESKNQNAYGSFLSDLITKIENANVKNVATNTARARLFRITSWLLIMLFTIALGSIVMFALESTFEYDSSFIFDNVITYMRCIRDR